MSGTNLTIGIFAIAVIIIVVWTELEMFTRTRKPRQPHQPYRARHILVPTMDMGLGVVTFTVEPDTEQLSSFDRQRYMEAHERLTDTYESMLLPTEEEWAEEIRRIFAESAQIDAWLDTEVLAFPEWGDGVFPHNEANTTCPGMGMKCLCWDLAQKYPV
jgi:hypothetical protein